MAMLTKHIQVHFFQLPSISFNFHSCNHRSPPRISAALSFRNPDSRLIEARKLVDDFDPQIPLEKALTPPSSWYIDPSFFALELNHVFYRGWQAVGSLPSLNFLCFFFYSIYAMYV